MAAKTTTAPAAKDVEKLLPQNVDAERGVLGSILLSRDAMAQVADMLQPNDFYIEAHRLIYQAALDVQKHGVPADLITITDELTRTGHLEDAGGAAWDAPLHAVPYSGNATAYAEIVQRTAIMRRLIDAAGDIGGVAFSEPDDIDGVLEFCIERVKGAVGEGRRRKTAYHLLTVQQVMNQPKPDPLIDTFYTLNSTGLMYAPPGVGKTVLLLDQMAHVALGWPWNGHPVKGGHVVYVCAEGQAFLPERLEALMRKLGVDDIPRLHILLERPQLLEARTVTRLIQSITDDLPEAPVWVAFDTVSQTANGARENDADQMGPYLGAMERIREATGAFVHAIHHTGKDEDRGPRGTSLLSGNTDTVIQVTKTDDVCVMKCHKQRGGWAPFKPFGFKVKSLALDGYADRTGPVIEVCEVPDDASGQSKAPPPQAQAVYDVFCALHSEYKSHPAAPGGVFFGTWEKRCKDGGISISTFKNARKRLMEEFNLIWQPEEKGPYYPVGWNPAKGTEGQDRDNCPSVDPIDPIDPDSVPEGQRDNPLREFVPLSLPGVNSKTPEGFPA